MTTTGPRDSGVSRVGLGPGVGRATGLTAGTAGPAPVVGAGGGASTPGGGVVGLVIARPVP